ncbi:MAG: gluconate:H+ symporter [Sphingomonadales bacterium]|nr:gluconate:H+ symporter [Sphingomonadales bacterium]MDE2170364.1 gluconate:H+ symporter [Sphingomonadales bacterium]
MNGNDTQLIAAALGGIGVTVALILAGRFHPFLALLTGAFVVGLGAGLSAAETGAAVEKGLGDIMGHTGLVVALGLSLGAMLQCSGAAERLARAGLALAGPGAAPWAALIVGVVVGLPLFFETGLVLLLPVMASAAQALRDREAGLRLILCAIAGLAVVHALVPPHPGPLIAIAALGADMGRTMLYGAMVALPTAVLAGPVLARYSARGLTIDLPLAPMDHSEGKAPGIGRGLTIVLMPVVLIAMGQLHSLLPAWVAALADPVLALLVTNLAALVLLFGRRMADARLQTTIWDHALKPAGSILLAIGAGGALKQVLVSAKLADLLAREVEHASVSPLILAWLVAAALRLAAGSATVATITAAGIMAGVAHMPGVSPEWLVLAIGSGSVVLSHVNDPGFWLVKSWLGTSTPNTFRTWSALETVISVAGLIFVLIGSHLIG